MAADLPQAIGSEQANCRSDRPAPSWNDPGLSAHARRCGATLGNFDYTFRAGLFAGDYDGNATGSKDPNCDDRGDDRTAAFFTDARNGRGSADPTSTQPGRNPICEQSDVFFDTYGSAFGGNGARGNSSDSNVFLVAPCPSDIKDHRQHW